MGRWLQVLTLLVVAAAMFAGGTCLLDGCADDPDHGAAAETCCAVSCGCQVAAALPAAGVVALPRAASAALRPPDDRPAVPLFAADIFEPPRA